MRSTCKNANGKWQKGAKGGASSQRANRDSKPGEQSARNSNASSEIDSLGMLRMSSY
jgi:hypothetical protein